MLFSDLKNKNIINVDALGKIRGGETIEGMKWYGNGTVEGMKR